jgi:hypothetical protein
VSLAVSSWRYDRRFLFQVVNYINPGIDKSGSSGLGIDSTKRKRYSLAQDENTGEKVVLYFRVSLKSIWAGAGGDLSGLPNKQDWQTVCQQP